MTALGFTLQPDEAFLDHTAPLCESDVDYFEVAPETTWRVDGRGRLLPNGFHRRFAALANGGRHFVAHGVGFSMSSDPRRDRARRRAWLSRIGEDHATFAFEWYSDHLGATVADGTLVTLPLPMPMDAATTRHVRANLRALQQIVADVAVENTANYFTLGPPLDEPAWIARTLRSARTWWVLDLHNVFTMACNLGFDPIAWLARAPLDRVIEIHVSGGEDSDPRWLPDGRTLRLDSHDRSVPDEVFRLLERVLPHCANLRGVTLERMEGSVAPADVAGLREELRTLRRMLRRRA